MTEATAIASEATILVVDGEAVSRRFVELALQRGAAYIVESAPTVAGALEILRTTRVDLIVAEMELPDASGLDLLRRVSGENRLRYVPIVFVTADATLERKVAALRAGAADYLIKPCHAIELETRIASLLERQQLLVEARRQRNYLLAGDFSALPFTDLIAILELGRRTGTLDVMSRRITATLYFDGGRIVSAGLGNLTGFEAFFQTMAMAGEGQFEFTPQAVQVEPTIFESATSLVMEGARRLDERNRRARVGPAWVEFDPLWSGLPGQETTLVSASMATPRLAAQLEREMTDQFSLGELRFLTHDELASWTSLPDLAERFHVHLICDVPGGVTAFAALAGGLVEREIIAALAPVPKVLVLDFRLRKDRILDVVLVDSQQLVALERILLRSPSLVIIAPPEGEGLALDTRTRVQIESLVAKLAPPCLIGVGDLALEGWIHRLGRGRGDPIQTQCIRGVLGMDNADLRHAVVGGLRLWGGASG